MDIYYGYLERKERAARSELRSMEQEFLTLPKAEDIEILKKLIGIHTGLIHERVYNILMPFYLAEKANCEEQVAAMEMRVDESFKRYSEIEAKCTQSAIPHQLRCQLPG